MPVMPAKQKRQPIHFDMKEFILTGRTDGVETGLTKEQVLANFPEPEGVSADGIIWIYGDWLELYFHDGETLTSIFTDHLDRLGSSKTIILDPWVIPRGLTLCSTESLLAKEGAGFSVTFNPPSRYRKDVRDAFIKVACSSVYLTFSSFDDESVNPDDYGLCGICRWHPDWDPGRP